MGILHKSSNLEVDLYYYESIKFQNFTKKRPAYSGCFGCFHNRMILNYELLNEQQKKWQLPEAVA